MTTFLQIADSQTLIANSLRSNNAPSLLRICKKAYGILIVSLPIYLLRFLTYTEGHSNHARGVCFTILDSNHDYLKLKVRILYL